MKKISLLFAMLTMIVSGANADVTKVRTVLLDQNFVTETETTTLPTGWTEYQYNGTNTPRFKLGSNGCVVNQPWKQNALDHDITITNNGKYYITVKTYASTSNQNTLLYLSSSDYSFFIGNSYTSNQYIDAGTLERAANSGMVSFQTNTGWNPDSTQISKNTINESGLTYYLVIEGTKMTGIVSDGTNKTSFTYTLSDTYSFDKIGFQLDGNAGTVGIKSIRVEADKDFTTGGYFAMYNAGRLEDNFERYYVAGSTVTNTLSAATYFHITSEGYLQNGNGGYLKVGSQIGDPIWNASQYSITYNVEEASAFTISAASGEKTVDGSYKVVNGENNNMADWGSNRSNKVFGISDADRWACWVLEEINCETATMKITDAGWATFCAPFEITELPTDVKAYTGQIADNSWVKLTEQELPIAAGTPLVLAGSTCSQEYADTPAVTECLPGTCLTGNLTGAVKEVGVSQTSPNYLLQNGEEGLGWYKVADSGLNIGKNRCYMTMTTPSARVYYGMGTETTAINSIAATASKMSDGKYLVNGRIIAVKAGKAYNMNGTQVK